MRFKKIGAVLLATLLLCTITVQAKTHEEASIETVVYDYDYTRNIFVPEGTLSTQTKGIKNVASTSYQNITVDNIHYKVRVLEANYNAEKSNAIPYSKLSRVMSIANNQIATEGNTNAYTQTSSISKAKKSNNSFSFGIGTDNDKKPETEGLLSKISKALGDFSFDIGTSLQKNYSIKNTKTTVKQHSKTEEITYATPSQYNNANGVDTYYFSAIDVYDMRIELIDDRYTDNIHKGYTELVQSYLEPVYNYYGEFIGTKCNHCGNMIEVGPGAPIYHVIFPDGHTEHYDMVSFPIDADDHGIKPYRTDHKTLVSYEYYHPVIKGATIPWYINGNNTLPSINQRPIHLVAPGSEEIVYGGGRHYMFRVIESPLVQPYITQLPGKQVGYPLLPGVTQKISFSDKTIISTSTENITSTAVSSEVKFKFAKYITLSAGAKHESEEINTTYQAQDEEVSIYKSSTYTLPSYYIEQGYDGAVVYETVDVFTYKVKGEIIPIKSDGTLDESNKSIITFQVEREQPRRYSKPYDA